MLVNSVAKSQIEVEGEVLGRYSIPLCSPFGQKTELTDFATDSIVYKNQVF